MIIERLSNLKAHPQVSKGAALARGECTCPTKPSCQAPASKTLNVGKDSNYSCLRFVCLRCVNHRKSCRRAVPLSKKEKKKQLSKSTEKSRKRAVRTSCKEVSTWSMSEKNSMLSTSQVQWDDPSSGHWHCRRYPNHLQESHFKIEAGLVDVGPWESRRVVKHDPRDDNKAQP